MADTCPRCGAPVRERDSVGVEYECEWYSLLGEVYDAEKDMEGVGCCKYLTAELARERERVEELMGVLRLCCWGDHGGPFHHPCPVCDRSYHAGHRSNCRLSAALRQPPGTEP